MKPEEIKLSDWTRMFLGEVPAEFYVELLIRGALIYLLLMVSMRLLGKRMSGHISNLELAAMVALASAIGVPMLSPMNGILPAIIIAMIIVAITRLVAYFGIKSEKFESLSQGEIDTLVMDGVMHLDCMRKVRVTRERLFAQLRSENMNQLGRVKRLYMEANGSFTMIQEEKPQPGLMLLPDWDEAFVSEKLKETNVSICKECGANKPTNGKVNDAEIKCTNCGANEWTQAVEER
jgi:uncharacterized membrane protein YcaP (DUF421 family)